MGFRPALPRQQKRKRDDHIATGEKRSGSDEEQEKKTPKKVSFQRLVTPRGFVRSGADAKGRNREQSAKGAEGERQPCGSYRGEEERKRRRARKKDTQEGIFSEAGDSKGI